MADHNETMRLADWLKARQSHLGSSRDSCWEDDRPSWDDYDKAAALLRQQAERIAELQSAHGIAVEIAAQYAAERDQLREEVERMSKTDAEILACNYPDGEESGPTISAPDYELISFARQLGIRDAARTTHKETE